MRLMTSDRQVVAGGLVDQKAFSVEMNSMLFHSVISGIYADKIRAPFRELATNARDAHVAAGKPDQPFDVQLPSYLDPTFRIRDYGCSMTHDEVMGLYSTMFASSKRNTNDLTGMIGLGSKSAFAYTSIFNVTVWKDGERRQYSCYIGEDEQPYTALISREPSDEPQGVEVSFAVKQEDIEKFRRVTNEVLFGFDPKPNILNETFKWSEPVILYQGDGWVIYNKDTVPFKTLMARQGSVLYPVQKAPLEISHDPIFDWACVLDFPIGELSVSTSRENLGYDKRTRENLINRINKARKDMAKLVSQEVEECKTYLDACVLLKSKTSWVSPERQFWELVENGLTWRGKSLSKGFKVQPTGPGYSVSILDPEVTKMGVVKTSISHRPKDHHFWLDADVLRDRTLVFHEKGSTKFGPSRMRRAILDNKDEKVIIWIRTVSDTIPEELKEALGWTDIIDLETVEPLTNSTKRNKDGDKIVRLLRYIQPNNNSYYIRGQVTTEAVEITKDLLYVEQDGHNFRLGGIWYGYHTIYRYLNSAVKAKLLPEDTKVYCLNQVNIKLLEKVKMTPVEDVIRANIRELLPKTNLTIDSYSLIQRQTQAKNLRAVIDGVPIPSDIEDYLSQVEKEDVKVSAELDSDTRRLIELLCPEEYNEQRNKSDPLNEMRNALNEKYPLLFLLGTRWGPTDQDKRRMKHYMELLLK